jgi:hypothetical protein
MLVIFTILGYFFSLSILGHFGATFNHFGPFWGHFRGTDWGTDYRLPTTDYWPTTDRLKKRPTTDRPEKKHGHTACFEAAELQVAAGQLVPTQCYHVTVLPCHLFPIDLTLSMSKLLNTKVTNGFLLQFHSKYSLFNRCGIVIMYFATTKMNDGCQVAVGQPGIPSRPHTRPCTAATFHSGTFSGSFLKRIRTWYGMVW